MSKPINILLVEDAYDDILIMKDVLEKHGLTDNLKVIRDGEEAVQYIFKQGPYTNVCTPQLVLLDFNLPKKNGLEVLREIRNHTQYSYLPIVILSTSSSPIDIADCYAAHVNCFITKPTDMVTLYNTVGQLKTFWLETVKLPHLQ